VQLTRRLLEAGRVLGIEILDHLIIGGSDMVSLRALGVMPPHPPRTMRGTPAARRGRPSRGRVTTSNEEGQGCSNRSVGS
jgi:hypothetical protein